jgi:small conductance mechanosensitive channel
MTLPWFEAAAPMLVGTGLAIGQAVLRLSVILIAACLGTGLARLLLQRLEGVMVRTSETRETVPGSARKRVVTLMGLLRTVTHSLIWGIAGVSALDQIGLNVLPLLAGAGIAGLAVGFGAQSLVRDAITGFFVILENHVQVGDVAVVNGTAGLVEAISFRTIVLRDVAGVVHVFPHGTVTTLANMTKQWSGYVMDIGVSFKEDTDRVVEVMRTVDEELRRDAAFGAAILEPIEVFGVDAFGESQVTVKARIKTLPAQQWTVGREYRRRLKKAFDTQGIEIPVPHRSIHLGGIARPLEGLMRAGSAAPA